MKKSLLMGSLMLVSVCAFSQIEGGAFTETGRGAAAAFVTDYQALGINPANIAFGNEYNKRYTFGLGQMTLSNYAEGFTKSNLRGAILGVDDDISADEQFNAARDFANTVLSLDFTMTLAGFAVNTEKAGNFAFAVNFKGSHYSVFNDEGANHLWRGFVDPYFDRWVVEDESGIRDTIANQGPDSDRIEDVILGFSSDPQNASALYNGTVVRDLAYMEYHLGYGRQIVDNDEIAIYAGASVKYMEGIYVLDVTIEDNEVQEAYTASSPAMNIDYGSGALTNPSLQEGTGFTPVGDGFGFDLGLAIELNDQFRVTGSITDIGSINFDGNVYTSSDTLIYDINSIGIESYNIFTEFDVFAGDDGVFEWTGVEDKKVKLPTKARFGIGYFHSEKFRIGLDMAFPLNEQPGNLDRFSFAMGGDYIPIPAVRISAGFGAGDNYAFRVPFGLNFMIGEGTWEFGVASRDILYYFKDDKPNLSLAMGFLRFRFGEMDKGNPSRMFN